jgi:hypothetical protein
MLDLDQEGWLLDFETATAAARQAHKPILLQFHRDKCSGCRKLYATTYADPEVNAELHQWFVPLRLDILQQRQIRSRYAAVWTPSFYFLDVTGKAYYHIPGYLNPEDFRVILRLGKAAVDVPHGRYPGTIALMDDGLARFPANPRAAAMLFQKGMALYLSSWDNQRFRAIMTELVQRYPDSAEARMWPWLDEPTVTESTAVGQS